MTSWLQLLRRSTTTAEIDRLPPAVMAIFVTLIATAALVIMFEVAPTGTGNSSAVVVNHTQ